MFVLQVQEAQICEIVEGLVHHLLTNKVDGLTDIYSIGLSCVVKGVPSTMGATLAQRLAPRLLDGITTDRHKARVFLFQCHRLGCIEIIITFFMQSFSTTCQSYKLMT